MVKIDSSFNHQTPPDSSANQNSTSTDQNTKPQSGLMTIIGQLLPLAPFAFEQFTGQKVPQMTGTMAEMQMSLTSIQTNLQVIVNNQQSLNQRLIALENNATQHLTNLTQQFNSLRLTHTREKKEIEYNPNPNQINEDY
jgi:hypothetical protein